MSDEVVNNINTKYESSIISGQYKDVMIVTIICTIVLIVLIHYLILVNSQPIINDWNNRRCDPAVIPFAGIINAPEGKSIFDFTAENFSVCLQEALKTQTRSSLKLVENDISNIAPTFAWISDEISATRQATSQLQLNTSNVFVSIYDRLATVTLPIADTIAKMKDVLHKTNASISVATHTMRGGIITTESVMLDVYEHMFKLLWTLHAFIISCFTMGCLYPSTIAAGVSASTFLSMLLLPLVSLVSIMELLGEGWSESEFAAHTLPPLPRSRRCFDGRTNIATKYDGDIMIKHLTLGQELLDGSIVTALTKSTSTDMILYRLGSTVVTGTHRIYDSHNGWIDVSNYNNKILVENFSDPYVYCIGTNNKLIKINDLIFSDWDEVDDVMIAKLCGDTMDRIDIHKQYEVGLHPDTVIQLHCGKHIKIKDVEVNDRLICGAVVETVLKVKTDDINEFCEITYSNGLIILAAKNTEFIVGDKTFETRIVPPPDICYHIVTDCGGFKITDVFISDYNRGIDKFFE